MTNNRFTDSKAALDTAQRLVDLAKAAGADVAEAGYAYDRQASVTYRAGQVVSLEQSEGLDVQIRVWVGGRVASLSGNQLDSAAMKDLAEQAVSRAKILPKTPLIDLPSQPDTPRPAFDVDETEISLADLETDAKALYDGLMAQAGIVNSDGGTAGYAKARTATATSHGLAYTNAYSQAYRQVGGRLGQTVPASAIMIPAALCFGTIYGPQPTSAPARRNVPWPASARPPLRGLRAR